MIRQNWNIDDDEKRRILNLHESATKRHYIIKEQVNNQPDIKKGMTPEEFAKTYGLAKNEKGWPVQATDQITLQFNFATGFWSPSANSADGTTTIVDQVNDSIQKVKDFLSKYFLPRITSVTISSGESLVPNRDNESPSRPRLNTGELASRRSETIQQLLTTQINSLVTNKLIKKEPPIQISDPVIGTSTVKDSAQAIAEQFVTATIDVVGFVKEDTPKPPPCNFDLDIVVEYIAVGSLDDKYHNCNDAEFTLLLNNVPIKCNETGTDIFSLNNFPLGKSKKQTLKVTPEQAKQILGTSETVDVSFKCMSSQCHESPLLMTIFSGGQKISGPTYMGTAKQRKDRMPKDEVRKVATMDKCGKIVNVESFSSDAKDEKPPEGGQ